VQGAFGASFKKKTPSKKELLAQQQMSQKQLENTIDVTARTSTYYLGPVSSFQVSIRGWSLRSTYLYSLVVGWKARPRGTSLCISFWACRQS
jgi:hypothetical protein